MTVKDNNQEIVNVHTLEERVLEALYFVKDPEIDAISIIELGMLEKLEVLDNKVKLQLLPTFMGCPALDIIKNNIEKALSGLSEEVEVEVQFIYHPPWTSARVSEAGRQKLKEFGIAPPPKVFGPDGSWSVNCPYCDSEYTSIDNLFGPTACRSILYCKSCKNPFEAMKPVSTLM
ncbi:1,2-phenylacetyl-CoA epoxidase subunit PaaD [Bacillus canaveralius]|uniref:1,2-phenylacetyl-CoA epoxidase subunit PaaD n=1 Tax=Bacillus canaveralius TaxID=1403243 RepID=UPI000F7A2FD1|nr:1,2-phenylacetyl-CoA epoxidase subunit PaaD [Bacillus canaveralius]RSK45595.1 phenylacetate-CoA oxygenase subunit PaaJ [Bacillus canaveralius]